MSTRPWPLGAATGIGSMPGTDSTEAAAIVFGELAELPHVPELPARGVGADIIGRTAALLVDLAVDVVPSGYRAADHPGAHHRRAVDLLRWDMDAVEKAAPPGGTGASVIKTQLAGPWTLAAGIELATGHRVLTDSGALREFVESALEGLRGHVRELTERTDARALVQLDEPTLPDVLAGALPTPSGYGTVDSVPEPEARAVLATMLDAVADMTGQPVIVRVATRRPPVALLRAAGAGALAVDATVLDGAPASVLDEVGEAWDAGLPLLLGLVPADAPSVQPSLAELAQPALTLVDRLGFDRSILAEQAVPTPTHGLGQASSAWTRRAISLARDLGKAFVQPPESW